MKKENTSFNPDNKQIKSAITHKSGEAGGMLVGKRHSEGGIKAINKATGQPLEMEGGEVVITRNAVSDPKKRMFNGKMMTNREILSTINQSGGGVSFADGGEIPSEIYFTGKSYDVGGELLSDMEYASRMIVDTLEDGGSLGLKKGGKIYHTPSEATEIDGIIDSLETMTIVDAADTGFMAKGGIVKKLDDLGLNDNDKPSVEKITLDFDSKDSVVVKNYDEFFKEISKTSGWVRLYVNDESASQRIFIRTKGRNNSYRYNVVNSTPLKLALLISQNDKNKEFNWTNFLKTKKSKSDLFEFPTLTNNGEPKLIYLESDGQKFYSYRELINFLKKQTIGRGYVFDFVSEPDTNLDVKIYPKEGRNSSKNLNPKTANKTNFAKYLVHRWESKYVDWFNFLNDIKEVNEDDEKYKSEIIDFAFENSVKNSYLDGDVYKLKPYILGNYDGMTKDKIKELDLGNMKFVIVNNLFMILKEDGKSMDFLVKIGLMDTSIPAPKYQYINDSTIEYLHKRINQLSMEIAIKKPIMTMEQLGFSYRELNELVNTLREYQSRKNEIGFENIFNDVTLLKWGDINKKYKATDLLSINGKKSELTKPEYLTVRTDKFKSFFGDWELAYIEDNYEGVSKVINESTKEPLAVFHGTNVLFTDWKVYETNNAHYFAAKREMSEFFATSWDSRGDKAALDSETLKALNPTNGEYIYRCFLDIKNPIDFSRFGVEKRPVKDFLNYLKINYNIGEFDFWSNVQKGNILKQDTLVYAWQIIRLWQSFTNYVKTFTIHDGYIFYEYIPDSNKNGIDDASLSFCAFESNQIKFTNAVEFNALSKDSRYMKGGKLND